MSDAYSDRGNKDLSLGNAKGQGSVMPKSSGDSFAAPDDGPFLIGDGMTAGYGDGPDILHDCTISVDQGEIAVIVGPNGAGKTNILEAVSLLAPGRGLRRAQPADFARQHDGYAIE